MTTEDKSNTTSKRLWVDAVNMASECDKALCGLATFASWWNAFKAHECQGIDASFELCELMVVKFRFRRGSHYFEESYDLTYCFAPGAGVIRYLQGHLSALRDRARETKLNVSES